MSMQDQAVFPPQTSLASALEAILMVIDEPATARSLAQACDAHLQEVQEQLQQLSRQYQREQRGFVLREIAGGWRIYSSPEYAEVVGEFLVGGQTAKLSQAALETLAVVAYLQPVSRGRIASVRGVSVEGVLRTLRTRGLVDECGQEASGAILYETTPKFLEVMGLKSLDELEPLAPHLPPLEDLEDVLAGLEERL